MSQLQEVVRCYSCETFQVQIKKKANKWICKICNEKQSLKKVYFTGLGAECRNVVKDFNSKRGEMAETKVSLLLKSTEEETSNNLDYNNDNNTNQYDQEYNQNENSENPPNKVSKWTNFLTPEEIKEAERAFSKKNDNSQTIEEEYIEDFEDFAGVEEEDFDCESYLQNNSVNNEEDFLQLTSKTLVGEDISNTWNSSNSKSGFKKSSEGVKKRSNNVNSKKSKWSSFTSTNESSNPTENNYFEHSNKMVASDMLYNTKDIKESDLSSASTILALKQPLPLMASKQPLLLSKQPLKASSSIKQPLGLSSAYSQSSGVSKQPLAKSMAPLAASTSFKQSTAIKQPLAAFGEPLTKQSVRTAPVMTDFAKKFLLNRK